MSRNIPATFPAGVVRLEENKKIIITFMEFSPPPEKNF